MLHMLTLNRQSAFPGFRRTAGLLRGCRACYCCCWLVPLAAAAGSCGCGCCRGCRFAVAVVDVAIVAAVVLAVVVAAAARSKRKDEKQCQQEEDSNKRQDLSQCTISKDYDQARASYCIPVQLESTVSLPHPERQSQTAPWARSRGRAWQEG